MLENHRNLLAELAKLLRAERGEILTVDDDVARCRLFQKVNAAHERRFARTGHADDSKNIALLDVQVDVFQGVYRLGFALEGLCQMVQLNERQDGSTPFNMRMELNHVVVMECIIYETRCIDKHGYYMVDHR